MLFILFLFFKYLQPVFQEFDIVGDTFVKCIRRAERFAFGIQQNVKRLGVCTELTTLQVTPFVADCFQFASLAMLFDCDRLRQLRLIIDHQGDQDIIIFQYLFHFRVGSNGCFHLAAVHATETGEIDQDRLVHLLGISHTGFVIVKSSMHFTVVQVEILSVQGRSESTDRF